VTANNPRRDYLDPATLRHVVSHVGDCRTDPGELTIGQAQREREFHQYCSPECRVRARVEQRLGTDGGAGQTG
jgi:hypothetical protein